MKNLAREIENIILQFDKRGIKELQKSLEPGYCFRAANLILKNKGTILLGTGFPIEKTYESDGPIGSIALYYVLKHINNNPVFVCAPPVSKILAKNFNTHEIPILDWKKSKEILKKTIEKLTPSLIISVERPGITKDGHYYNMRKQDISNSTAKFDLLFEYSSCPSIGFGDGGNEIGMGNVSDKLRYLDIIPAVTKCSELIIASVSNWGVYGVIAILSKMLKQDLFKLFSIKAISQLLIDDGCLDGVTKRQEQTEDGFPIEVGLKIIAQLKEIIGIN